MANNLPSYYTPRLKPSYTLRPEPSYTSRPEPSYTSRPKPSYTPIWYTPKSEQNNKVDVKLTFDEDPWLDNKSEQDNKVDVKPTFDEDMEFYSALDKHLISRKIRITPQQKERWINRMDSIKMLSHALSRHLMSLKKIIIVDFWNKFYEIKQRLEHIPECGCKFCTENVTRLQGVVCNMIQKYPNQKIILVVKDIPMSNICEISKQFPDILIVYTVNNTGDKAIDDHAMQILEVAAVLQNILAEIETLDKMEDKFRHRLELAPYQFYLFRYGNMLKSFYIDPKKCHINDTMPSTENMSDKEWYGKCQS